MPLVLWVRSIIESNVPFIACFSEKDRTPPPPTPLEPEPKEATVSDLSNVDYREGDKLTLQGQRVFIYVR